MFFSKKKKENTPANSSPPADITALVEKLISDFRQEKQTIIDKALSINKGFNKEWDDYLLSWNITPRMLAQREADLKTGVAIEKGALPVEVREVFVAFREKYATAAKLLRNTHANLLREEDDVEEKLWEFEHRTLPELAEVETRKYIKKVKKNPTSSIDNALANAEQNQNKWSANLQEAKSYMIRCKNCGAARLHTHQYDQCNFCGSELFEKIEK